MGIFSSGKSGKPDKVVTTDKGSKTQTREYNNGKTTRISETEKKTGKTTDYNIGRNMFGAYKADKKK